MTSSRILVVEDDSDTRRALGELLTILFPGSRVLMAESGEAALELIRRDPDRVRRAAELKGEPAPVDEIFHAPRHPYTQALLRSIPRIDMAATKRQRLEPIPGTVPILRGEARPGCRFAPRCALAKPMHFENTPPLKEVRPGHKVACFLY